MKQNFLIPLCIISTLILSAAVPAFAVTATTQKSPTASTKRSKSRRAGATTVSRSTIVKRSPAAKSFAGTATIKPATARSTVAPRRVRKYYSPWDTPTFADSTYGDVVDGEDLAIRRAAVQALGPYNGSVVVVDPTTGRVMTMVNQKLALTGAYQPCSTIKLVAGLAGLSEGIIERETRLRLSRRESINLTTALAKSNNAYFANVGEKLGFEKINYYGRLFGLGEKAGINIEGESAGIFPEEKPKGVPNGMMTSFGEAIGLTPLQLAAIVSSIANGGTLYYLQYPRTLAEVSSLVPQVKRQLDIAQQIPEMRPGMMGAVEFGTARRANYDTNEPIFGKTGTCTDSRTHLGWFGSFNEVGKSKLVVVVLLTGGKSVNGPVAAGIAGQVYKNLSEAQFFTTQQPHATAPTAMIHSGDVH
ncbi:penicillin-binding transpeptidase domain-containing protein [Paludibaculum fermentans]|uniref:beta-lactamase n=1 Tax=Paludibaculum fermentans TaxID=1473598 RepID=A0A7S7NMZ1_PALFE|nr:penicillin-binding transpeptidase domain-containing protein [Paludibaculum fermentans]QOY86598.1 penicillin-binding protein [Paludibaculum fermentans]